MLSTDPTVIGDSIIGDADLRKEIMSRYKMVEKHYKQWDKTAKEDYQFALGDQWTEEDRQALKDQGRPCLTFNRIRSLINIISGYQRENSSRIKVSPEGGEDKIFSEVNDKIVKFIDKGAHLSYKMGYWFDDGCYCGKAFLESSMNYEKDAVRGELGFQLCSPYQVMTDPDFKEYDLNDGCEYLFKVVKLRKTALIDLFPDKKELIEGFTKDTEELIDNVNPALLDGSYNDYGNIPGGVSIGGIKDKKDQEAEPDFESDVRFTLKEYWRIKRTDKWFVMNPDSGEPKQFDKKKEAEDFASQQGITGLKPTKRQIKEMWVADMCCGMILQDVLSPFEPHYNGFPFFRFMVDWAPNSENEVDRVQGITRMLKDPQKEKNKAKSQYLHILNTQANSGWIGDEEALTPTGWQDLKKMGAMPGVTVKKKKGFELREILPKGPNQGHLIREEKADEEFKQISGVNPDLLGMQGGTDSGVAISMRIKQAVLALARLFANYRYSKEIVGNFMLAMVPLIMDVKKISKILGSDYMAKAVSEKYPTGLSEGNLAAFLTMITDDKYDVFVTEADNTQTIRHETFNDLVELVKAGVPIPPALIIQYMDIPNSDEVINQITQAQQQQAAAAAQGGGGAPVPPRPPGGP